MSGGRGHPELVEVGSSSGSGSRLDPVTLSASDSSIYANLAQALSKGLVVVGEGDGELIIVN